jgi:hypothetical protein
MTEPRHLFVHHHRRRRRMSRCQPRRRMTEPRHLFVRHHRRAGAGADDRLPPPTADWHHEPRPRPGNPPTVATTLSQDDFVLAAGQEVRVAQPGPPARQSGRSQTSTSSRRGRSGEGQLIYPQHAADSGAIAEGPWKRGYHPSSPLRGGAILWRRAARLRCGRHARRDRKARPPSQKGLRPAASGPLGQTAR